MNLFEKIQTIRVELRELNLKPTGYNAFSNYYYFELDDFLPQLSRLMEKYKMTAIATFDKETAKLIAINAENPEETYAIKSPFGTANLKGCHEVQCIGAVETYQRRYLYMALFDIGEKDSLDGTTNPSQPQGQPKQVGGGKKNNQSKQNKPQNGNDDSKTDNEDVNMTTEEATEYMITFGKHANTPFKDIPEFYLKWLVETAKVPKTKKAAQLVLDSIANSKKVVMGSQLEMIPLSQEEQDELPF